MSEPPRAPTIELQHAPVLCYAMQQAAVRWLHRIAVTQHGTAPLRELRLELRLGDFAAPCVLHLAELPPGVPVELLLPDPSLRAEAFANAIERQRVDLVATLHAADGALLATHGSPLDVLAYDEWPGPGELPALLAAFVSPNHPALLPLLAALGERLPAPAGSAGRDVASHRPERSRAVLAAVHDVVAACGIAYMTPPPSFEQRGQKVRTPEQVLAGKLATCLDLALLYAALLEHVGEAPLVVLTRDHAFVGCWTVPGSAPQPELGPAVELRKRVELGALLVLECTQACAGNVAPFDAACRAAVAHLAGEFARAIDVQAARAIGIRPLPVRTLAFAPQAAPSPASATTPTASTPAASPVIAEPEPADASPPGPKDRLEHWRQKLLDLSLNNRLLNAANTKKTVPLAAHDLRALEDRFQQGSRLRVLGRPNYGKTGEVERDVELASQRSGVDIAAEFLASELRAGRVRAELPDDELEDRLVEIFRHARSSLEETGANTLYLAVGFLRWCEPNGAQKPRHAPLLLLPLAVERSSVQDGVRFRLDDDEPRLNTTLLQFLQRDFQLRVALHEVPEDEHGVDVGAVLDAFRHAVLGMPGWEVEARASIGFFAFTKYLMWLDLADRDGLLQSPVLQHLVERPGEAFAQEAHEVPRDELDDRDAGEVLCPKDADSSQLAAVLSAAGGRSFVLEGPPGTGKSQTITNLIAQSLAQGSRVLFVAEKRAALEVVQRRLAEVGLGPFCLELHSSKSGPKAVLAQLQQALELGQRRVPAEWQRVASDLQDAREALNDLVRALHRPREHGGSVYAAMGELIALRAVPTVPLPGSGAQTSAAGAATAAAIDALAHAAAPLPVPSTSPWWGVQRRDWTPALDRQVGPALAAWHAAALTLAASLPPLAQALALPQLATTGPGRAQLAALHTLVTELGREPLPPRAWWDGDWRVLAADGDGLLADVAAYEAAWAPLAGRWRRELLDGALDAWAEAARVAAASGFLLRWWRFRAVRAAVQPFANGALAAATPVAADLAAARQVRALAQRVTSHTAVLATLPATPRVEQEPVRTWLATMRTVRAALAVLAGPDLRAPLAAIASFADGSRTLGDAGTAFLRAHAACAAAFATVQELLALDVDAAFGPDTTPGWLSAAVARAQAMQGARSALRDHCAYATAAAAVPEVAAPLVRAHARGDVATAALVQAYRSAFLTDWLDRVHAQEPALARFRGLDHERAIERFRDLDRRALALAAEVVVARLAAAVPQLRDTQAASSELGVLQRELKKQRRHKPVRTLLAEIPGLFGKLAPCVLMSPLSVARFLGRKAQRFDLVVFDEASQIPMHDAVSAIGRGRSLVVVGDSRQLPPTSFFQRQAQGDDIGQDELPDDLESVLDECGAAGLPRQHLDWHYRSRHESLIAFSNHHYYGNRLLTFPAPAVAAPGVGVRCVRVAGVYDRAGSQTNRVEAEALVAEVTQRLLDPQRGRQSLGIVTFSQAQQVLVEDLLDQAARTTPALDQALTAAREPLFVKNLENVQGDERDVILFSIGYGPDAQGRVHENYGPLNLQGGERRLNVAITRARAELVVFTSVGPEQIANRTPALGARHLRTFLDYALRGAPALAAATTLDPGRGPESPFEAAVLAALRARGHEVHTQVGCSGYRVDLAVVDPRAPGRYLLGIECDGASYHSAATARDRDRLRASVLQTLGWRLHRVWSTDFWLDEAGELARLDAAIARALTVPIDVVPPVAPIAHVEVAAAPGAAAAMARDEAEHADAAPVDPDGPRAYVVKELPSAGTPEQFQTAPGLRVVRDLVVVLLLAEGPLQFDRLARAVATTFALTRLTDRVRERVRSALPKDVLLDGETVWAHEAQRAAFTGFRGVAADGEAPRAAEELPPVELANALRWLLRQHQAIGAEDLAREAARAFGITRLGAVVKDVMDAAIVRLVAAGYATRDGDVLRPC